MAGRYELPEKFYQEPEIAFTTVTKTELAHLLLWTEGFIVACGHCWNITNKHLGGGIYEVRLKERNI